MVKFVIKMIKFPKANISKFLYLDFGRIMLSFEDS